MSVIVPAYERADLLRKAITSVPPSAGSLDFEVIVVDDCSPEPLQPVCDIEYVRYVRLSINSGSSVARNCGIDAARGKFLKFLDSDDVLLPQSIANDVAKARACDADIVIGSWRETVLNDGGSQVLRIRAAPVFDKVSIVDGLLAGYGVPTGAALYRTSSVADVRWDPSLSAINDWDFFVKSALRVKKIATSDSLTYDWQSHSGARITDYTIINHARAFHLILDRLATELEAHGELNVARRRRLAQYLYKDLRILFCVDRKFALAVLRKIYALDAAFSPNDEEPSSLIRAFGHRALLRPMLEIYGLLRRLYAMKHRE